MGSTGFYHFNFNCRTFTLPWDYYGQRSSPPALLVFLVQVKRGSLLMESHSRPSRVAMPVVDSSGMSGAWTVRVSPIRRS